jgi:hypothetical protein
VEKIKSSKPKKEHSVAGVSGKSEIGHATKVFPVAADMDDFDLSKVQWCRPSMKGYDKKAFEYKH